MDLVSSCKKKLVRFRIKELKDVLGQLGLGKQGRKQDLMERILALLSKEVSEMHGLAKKKFIGKERVAKIIDDAYRKLQGSGATDSTTNGQSVSGISSVMPKEEEVDSLHLDKKIRCPCGSSLPTEYMIQCADPECHVLQHICCVIIPEESLEGIPPVPPPFYCEICRINRADPFWVTLAHSLSPFKLIASNTAVDGTNQMQTVEKEFELTSADRHLLETTEYGVQAWCILLNDCVPFRMQWPQYADLQVNGMRVKTVNRPGSQLLGANGRDDGPLITLCVGEGFNKISLSGCDARSFCLGVRLVKQRTLQQVLNLIPKEHDGEPFANALARVCRCIGGGMAMANEDSDSDLEVIADSVTVNLRCPMSGSRIKTAGRFKPCAHMGCFDLETYVELNQHSRKWQCPICMKNYSLEDIIIDPYFNLITNMMRDCGEDITEIDVKPDGSWRAKNECPSKNLEQWHLADGSLHVSAVEVVSNVEAFRQIKQAGIAEGSSTSKLGIKENERWVTEVSKPQDMMTLSSGNQLEEYFENYGQKVITMSSSASESGGDEGSQTISQYGSGHFNISANNGNVINSMPCNFDPASGIINRYSSASLGNPDIIVLSDSEEENANLVSPRTATCSVNDDVNFFSALPGIANGYLEDPPLGAGPGFQLFGADADVSDAVVDMKQTPVTSSAPINGYTLASKCTMDSGGQVVDSFGCHSNTDINDSLVSNPLAFVFADPSLQTFLPTQPAGMLVQSGLGERLPTLNGTHSENWISFGLGRNSGAAGAHAESSISNGLDLGNQFESNEASLLPVMNDEARFNGRTNRKRSDGPFSFPRQPRSERRLYLSIDSDSE